MDENNMPRLREAHVATESAGAAGGLGSEAPVGAVASEQSQRLRESFQEVPSKEAWHGVLYSSSEETAGVSDFHPPKKKQGLL